MTTVEIIAAIATLPLDDVRRIRNAANQRKAELESAAWNDAVASRWAEVRRLQLGSILRWTNQAGCERLAERLGGRPNGDYVVRRIYAGRTGGWARKGLFLARSWDDAKLVFIPVTDLCDSRWSVVATSTTEET